jgi:hypothetical protein
VVQGNLLEWNAYPLYFTVFEDEICQPDFGTKLLFLVHFRCHSLCVCDIAVRSLGDFNTPFVQANVQGLNAAMCHLQQKYPIHLPSCPLPKGILSPPSRRQVILGWGVPVAAHRSVTFVPSRTTMSVLVG